MTREELQQIRFIKREIRLLEEAIKNPVITTDSVTGSMTQFPYIQRNITITGVDMTKHNDLQKKLCRKLADLQDYLNEMENWLDGVEDSEMRTILRLRYRNGMSWQQIARSIGHYDEQYPRKKHNKFFESTKSTKNLL